MGSALGCEDVSGLHGSYRIGESCVGKDSTYCLETGTRCSEITLEGQYEPPAETVVDGQEGGSDFDARCSEVKV